jgi:catechol 2,3-dioxygenase-like lactoylglutathione lyase family enzyme
MAEFPAPTEGILLTHFIVSDDVERSRRFYTDVLGGETIMAGEPSFVALANSWIIINVGGGPTASSSRRHRTAEARSAATYAIRTGI